jgi:protoporphyrinogen/coproporphyrinogen III oxidase
MKRIAIVGGGISGLSAAFELEKQKSRGAQLEYVLFEASSRFGGVIRTDRVGDCIVEAGPDSFLTEKPWAADLCRELGLGDQLIGSNDAARTTYILVKGRLVPLPDGMMFMVPTKLASTFFSPLFSWQTKLRMLYEWFYQPPRESSEVSVAEFVERHYGREMVERVADPLLAGIYGGSADGLSVSAVLPRFVEMEAKNGSLGRAMVASRGKFKAERASAGQPRAPVPTLFTSLRDGMQQMVDALLARIPASNCRLGMRVEAARAESGKWLILSPGRTEEFDGVIVALPAHHAARILAAAGEPAPDLAAIRYTSSVTVALGYDQTVRSVLPAGFGFLVPRSDGKRMLAATFVHNKFPHRAAHTTALIRCFLGGARDEGILKNSEAEIEALARRELEQIVGIKAQPCFAHIYKWDHAMAQYGMGHCERITRIRQRISEMPGLALAGNAYGGIGVPDCVRSGSEAAAKIFKDLQLAQPAIRRA